jgi:hypothetical protein
MMRINSVYSNRKKKIKLIAFQHTLGAVSLPEAMSLSITHETIVLLTSVVEFGLASMVSVKWPLHDEEEASACLSNW